MFADPAHIRKALRDTRGASAVEFALVAPAFCMMLIGLFVLGWSMHCISSLRLALEESGRALQIDQTLTATQLAALVHGELQTIGDPNVIITLADDTSIVGVKMARITGTYVFNISIPLLPTQQVSFQKSITVPLSAT